MGNQGEEKKKFYKKWWFWALAIMIFFIVMGSLKNNPQEKSAATTNQQMQPQQEVTENILKVETGQLAITPGQVSSTINTEGSYTELQKQPDSNFTSASETEQRAVESPSRTEIIDLLKKNALEKWKTDYEMVNYEVNKQTDAYDWIIKQTEYPDIMKKAKQKWGNDYEMVQYEYEKQIESYKALYNIK